MTARFCKKQTEGFALEKIRSNLSYHAEWEIESPNATELKAIFHQPFTYLSKGVQSYVFASQDGQYVIKLPRYDHLRSLPLVHLLPKKLAAAKIGKREAKLKKDFTSYKIAYEELREETGLVAIHLNKTDGLHQQVTLIDKLGIAHTLDLDKLEFLVQKRATLVYPTLEQWIREEKLSEAKEALASLVQVLSTRFDKKIFDKDPDLNTNFGFLGSQAIQIDVGRFRKTFPQIALPKKEAIFLITDNLHQWLQGKSPELASYLQGRINEI